MNRDMRVVLAQQTLEIINAGKYLTSSNTEINISAALENSINKTVLYRPTDFPAKFALGKNFADIKVEVTGETSLEAAARIINLNPDANPLVLNFASAKNPGGGFQNGSQAQEESLARSSGLYASLTSSMEMYYFNRRERSCLYSDHMIYSPEVPVFRNDDGHLLEKPYLVSFLTSPAPNAGAVKRNEPDNTKFIQPTLAARMKKLLWIAAEQQHPTLILGAWGCGVFQNNPAMVANCFAELLGVGGEFYGCFAQIVYAVFDRSPDQGALGAFERVLNV